MYMNRTIYVALTSLSILGLLADLPDFEFEFAAILRFFSSTWKMPFDIIYNTN